MTQPQLPPSLQQYPGYFPAAKPPFWTRTKVGLGGAIVGLVIGVSAGASAAGPATPPKADLPSRVEQAPATDATAAIETAVGQVRSEMADKLAGVREDARTRLAEVNKRAASSRQAAVARAVAQTRAQDRAQTAKAIAQVKAQYAAPQPAPAVPAAPAAPATDPRFSYCYEANDHGYGPYFQGRDPEYAWYDDADGDGEVCE